MIEQALKIFKTAILKPVENTNVYKPKSKLRIKKTVYPNGKPQHSTNGTGEWYGLTEN